MSPPMTLGLKVKNWINLTNGGKLLDQIETKINWRTNMKSHN